MSNLCDTTYNIYGSKKSIEKLEAILTELEVNCRNIYLDEVAERCNVDYKKHAYSVKGQIYFMSFAELENDLALMEIKTETAWTGCHDVMKAIIESVGEDISLSYMEIEPGYEIYTIHDEQGLFSYECYVTASGIFEELEGEYSTLDSAIEAWVKATGEMRLEDNEKMLEAIEAYNEQEEDDENYFSIHFFDYI